MTRVYQFEIETTEVMLTLLKKIKRQVSYYNVHTGGSDRDK